MIELIAIHLPKTGGRSFRAVLRNVYGEDKVFYVERKDYNDTDRRLAGIIPPQARVLHGHFRFKDVPALFKERGIPVVTWLRDPVERVVSNYYFFIRRLRECPNEHWRDHSRANETLLEYARREDTINRMSWFLDGIALSDMFFVGLTEHFTQDLGDLAAMLGWGPVEPAFENSNREFRACFAPPAEEELREIKRLNAWDVELYEKAVRLRESRRKMTGGAS